MGEESVPAYFIWLREISFLRYAFKGVTVNEFEGETFACAASDSTCIASGDEVLARMNFDSNGLIWQCALILVAMAVFFNILAYAILIYRRPRFQPLEDS